MPAKKPATFGYATTDRMHPLPPQGFRLRATDGVFGMSVLCVVAGQSPKARPTLSADDTIPEKSVLPTPGAAIRHGFPQVMPSARLDGIDDRATHGEPVEAPQVIRGRSLTDTSEAS